MPTFRTYSRFNRLWDNEITNEAEAQAIVANLLSNGYESAYYEQWDAAEDLRAKEEQRLLENNIQLFEHDGRPGWHYPIIVEKNMISFFDRDKLQKRTEMRMGRYLNKFLSNKLNQNEIADITAKYGIQQGDAMLKFATTREEIAMVYVNGPNSCMSHSKESFGFKSHPTEAYASPDFQVAYIERDGDITARVLICPKDKTYSTIYGDTVRMETLLEAQGYSVSLFMMAGKRLLVIIEKTRVILPYVDGPITCCKLSPCRKYWVFDEPECVVYANNTSGYCSFN